MKKFNGKVKGKIVEAKFAAAGKVARVSKTTGDNVKQWDLVASLDRKILQTELDKQLADFEKVRADFEIFAGKIGEPKDDVNKYLKTEKQAQLNASVKDVELAKARLDQVDLFSPVAGVILDDSNLTAGTYITPSANSVNILDTSSLYFEIEINQKDISGFTEPKKCKIEIEGVKENIQGETSPIIPDGKKFLVRIKLTENPKLLIGMKGKANF